STRTQKCGDLALIIVEDDAEELHVANRAGVVHEHGMLLVTRHAPRRPEVDVRRLSAQRSEIDCLIAANRLQRERRCGFADERRVNLRRIFAKANEENGDEGQSDGYADDEERAGHDLVMPCPSTRAARALRASHALE